MTEDRTQNEFSIYFCANKQIQTETVASGGVW